MDETTPDFGEFFESLRESDDVPADSVEELTRMVAGEVSVDLPAAAKAEVKVPDATTEKDEVADIRAMIADMGVPQKLKLAMFGNATCRLLLVQDSSRLVQTAVLKNPQLQENEIDLFSKNPNVSEFVS